MSATLKPSEVLEAAAKLIEPEEWRAVPGLPTHEASSLGRIRTVIRSTVSGRRRRDGSPPKARLVGGRVCAVSRDRRGYLGFSVGHSGKELVSRAVCAAFHGPPPFAGAICRHLDDDRDSNVPANLAWGTHADNAADRIRNGHQPRGPTHYTAIRRQAAELARSEGQ